MEKLHFIGNAHLDPVWLWRWPQGAAEIKATFQSALDRMEETPGYIFTAGAVSYYEWVMENEPEMFKRICQRVEEGRWVPVGGWWVQPDCNLPGGESFVRHSLLGQDFLRRYLGHPAKVGYNVDSFGHNAGLPQILNRSGMKYYVMMRPGEHEKHLPTVFWWEGPDGSRVLVYRIMEEYNSRADGSDLERKRSQYGEESARLGLPLMVFYGVGNHGGGPTVATLAKLTEMMKEDTNLLFSDPETYFAQLERYADRIPVVRGDLQHHASGCYSTDSPTKFAHRHGENELLAAERMMTVAHRSLGLAYEREELLQGWKTLLFNEFHDIMGGCSIRPALEDAHDALGEVRTIAWRNLNRALQKIAWNIDTRQGRQGPLSKEYDGALWETEAGGAPLVVFNTLPWEVTAPVNCYGVASRLEDEEGNALPTQLVRAPRTLPGGGSGSQDSLFMARVPAMGYRVYRVSRRLAAPAFETSGAVSAGSGTIENEFFRITGDPATGRIAEIFDKRVKRNILAGPVGCLAVDNTQADTWAHGIFSFQDLRGTFDQQGSLYITEVGPIRAAMRLTSRLGASEFVMDVSLTAGACSIDIQGKLLWLERQAMAKLAVPLAIDKVTAAWEQAYTVCEKAADGREVPAQCWGDITGQMEGVGAYGAALLNDGRYSYDALDGEIRLTLARSAAYADHAGPKHRDSMNECMDLGEHRVHMVLVPHVGPWWQAGLDRHAQELQTPLFPLGETYHEGVLPMKAGFAHVEGEGIRITALKPAEDGRGLIVRCWETRGRDTQGSLVLDFAKTTIPVSLHPFEIAGFRVKDDGTVTAVDLTETSC